MQTVMKIFLPVKDFGIMPKMAPIVKTWLTLAGITKQSVSNSKAAINLQKQILLIVIMKTIISLQIYRLIYAPR